MKKTLSMLLTLIIIIGMLTSVPLTANAASVDDLTFELNEDGKSYSVAWCSEYASGQLIIPATYNGLQVTKIGDLSFSECTRLTSITIPDSVTSIGNNAFNGCEKLESIVIPDSVKSIEFAAFAHCASLSSITIPDGITSIDTWVFSGCTSLTLITIPDSVTSIGEDAFSYCESLISIEIPDSVTSIDDAAFSQCTSLSSITFPDNVTVIPDSCFWDCSNLGSFTIPDGVTNIGESAFSGCSSLGSITIPGGVKSIGDNAFADCESLISVKIPDSVTSIGEAFGGCKNLAVIDVASENSAYMAIDGVLFNKEKTKLIQYPAGKTATTYIIPDSVTSMSGAAFKGCEYLESITIPDSVTSIGGSAFEGCESLASITIPGRVTSIVSGTFYNCKALSSITIPDSVTSIGRSAFKGTAYYDDYNNWDGYVLYIGNHFISAKTSLSGDYEIKEGTKTIAGGAFDECANLVSVTIPDGVASIGDHAFFYCRNLTSVTIPDSVTGIGEDAFYDCRNLASVTIPDGVTSIGEDAFYYCRSLTSITIPGSVKHIGDSAFLVCDSLTSITISDGVKSIGDKAFGYCASLKSITIPDSVTHIGDYAFDDCSYLSSVTIGDNVSYIGSGAFFDCERLISIRIPDSVTEIGNKAFGYRLGENGGYVKTKNFEIYGKKGSAAETYAKENGFIFIELCEHTSTKWVTDKKATVNAAGKKHKECTVCGEVLETATIKQLKCNAPKITAIANKSYGVRFVWNKVEGADSYIVYRKVSGVSYKYLGKTTKTAYADKTAKSGTKYYYVVKAVNEAGNSEKSASKGITFVGAPVIKTPTTAKSGITVKWGKVTGAEGYIVYRKTGSGSYEKLAKVKGGAKVSYLDKTAKKGKTYSYKVFAYKGSTKSAGSAVKTIKDKY